MCICEPRSPLDGSGHPEGHTDTQDWKGLTTWRLHSPLRLPTAWLQNHERPEAATRCRACPASSPSPKRGLSSLPCGLCSAPSVPYCYYQIFLCRLTYVPSGKEIFHPFLTPLEMKDNRRCYRKVGHWHKESLELKAIEKKQTQRELSHLPLFT